MPILSNSNLITAYDLNESVVNTRVLGFEFLNSKESAAQILVMELVRVILADGITTLTWEDMPEPEPWNTWWSSKQATAFESARLTNSEVSSLSQAEKDSAATVAITIFELTYPIFMDGISEINRTAFTKLLGVE